MSVHRKIFTIALLIFLLYKPSICHGQIIFASHKSDNGSLDQRLMENLIKEFKIDTFIESGTYMGETTATAAKLFKEVHTVELYQAMAEAAKTRFIKDHNITVYHGSSAEVFDDIIPKLNQKGATILFYLDAHYCGEGTAIDKEGPNSPDGITAVRKEIASIKRWRPENCVILVDDIRGFGSQVNGKSYLGCWAYPAVQEVCRSLSEVNPNFCFYLIGDMLIAYDKTKNNPDFSPTVKACTTSRLFDGSNYSKSEILEAELQISQASGPEKDFLKKLCLEMDKYNDPEFHYDLWLGLIYLNEGDTKNGLRSLSKSVNKILA